MKLKRVLLIASLLVVFGLAVGFGIRKSHYAAAQTSSCPATLLAPAQGQTINITVGSNYNAIAKTSNTTSSNVVNFVMDDKPLGHGNASEGGSTWGYGIPATLLTVGKHNVKAQLSIGSTTCSTAVGVLNVAPKDTTSSSLRISVSPANLEAPTYSGQSIVAHASLTTGASTQDVTAASTFRWAPTLGYIRTDASTANGSALFNTGPTAGSGKITITATLNKDNQTYTATQTVNLTIFSPVTDSSNQRAPDSTNKNTNETPVTAQAVTNPDKSPLPPITNPLDFLQKQDSKLHDCIEQAIGATELKRIQDAQQRLPFSAVEKIRSCLAAKNNVVPAYLAPVDPAKLKTLPVDKKLAVNEVGTSEVASEQGIVLSGVAEPNQTVLIYVFSEPLVLVANADGGGKWTYTLKDPLEPGSHEAYVTVSGDTAQGVRSNSFGFAVAAAPKTAENPLGLSFAIQKKNSNFYYLVYLVAAGLFVGLAAGAVILLVRHRHNAVLVAAGGGTISTDNFVTSTPPSVVVPNPSAVTEPKVTTPSPHHEGSGQDVQG